VEGIKFDRDILKEGKAIKYKVNFRGWIHGIVIEVYDYIIDIQVLGADGWEILSYDINELGDLEVLNGDKEGG
jgi:hypothetical protein